ncbi:AI-2E family transporter [Aridibaculum aurantiacum]|uniref:AI-2E family transporter n=1 Tax=Aridibaculum aurantiacum TaxID=2810307 RepID=UPI001A96A97B|nr:AI-2E family transporter [Aridibaculum aurantiacum]
MAHTQIDNDKIRQVFFLLFLIFLFIFLFLQMRSFLPGFLGAITFYMLLRKWMTYLVEKKRWKKSLAASLLLLLSFVIVLVPIIVTINILSERIGNAIHNSNQIVDAVNAFVKRLEARFDISIMGSLNPGNVSGAVANSLRGVVSATFSSITSIAVMYFILYFMLVSKQTLEKWVYEFMPLKDENVHVVGTEMKSLVISNALGIPLVAILQGIVGLIAYLILGVDDVWFWFLFTCIASMLPFVGAALAYVPLCIILYMGDQHWQAIFLLFYGFGIIGTVDNVFRFMLQKRMGDVHPLITVFGVIIGINLFGFIGLIFGPILISMFILLVKIYMSEFVRRRQTAENQLEV